MTSRRQPALSWIEQTLLGALALGLLAMLSFPAARSSGDLLGWLPFWLVALPSSAWLTARALRLREAAAHARRPLAPVHALAEARAARLRPPLCRAA